MRKIGDPGTSVKTLVKATFSSFEVTICRSKRQSFLKTSQNLGSPGGLGPRVLYAAMLSEFKCRSVGSSNMGMLQRCTSTRLVQSSSILVALRMPFPPPPAGAWYSDETKHSSMRTHGNTRLTITIVILVIITIILILNRLSMTEHHGLAILFLATTIPIHLATLLNQLFRPILHDSAPSRDIGKRERDLRRLSP